LTSAASNTLEAGSIQPPTELKGAVEQLSQPLTIPEIPLRSPNHNFSDMTRGSSWAHPIRPLAETPRPKFVAKQEWEGIVVEVAEDSIIAVLLDITAGDELPSEQATFPLDEIQEGDRDLIKLGAVFRWTIGYQTLPGGTKQRVSQIVFRRLPQWTGLDMNIADKVAAEWAHSFGEANLNSNDNIGANHSTIAG